MKSLVLHIGTTKTATTAVQKALRDGKKELARVGVIYAPRLKKIRKREVSTVAFYDAIRSFFSDGSKKNQILLVSAEGLSIYLADGGLTSVPLNDGKKITATCLIYLRQPADHFISQYSSLVRGRLLPLGPEQLAEFICDDPTTWSSEIREFVVQRNDDFIIDPAFALDRISRNRIRLLYSYSRQLDLIKENPLCGTLIVRAFDRSSFIGGDILSDFQHQIFNRKQRVLKGKAPTKNVGSSRLMLERIVEMSRSSSLTLAQRLEAARDLMTTDLPNAPSLKDDHALCRRIEDRLFQAFGDDYERLARDYGAHLAPIACRIFDGSARSLSPGGEAVHRIPARSRLGLLKSIAQSCRRVDFRKLFAGGR